MQYYREAASPPPPPPPSSVPVAQSDPPPPPEPPSAEVPCNKKCKDGAGLTCLCKSMSTISIYVQKGDAPTSIVGDYLWETVKGNTPQPDTGHTFIAIGKGDLSEQKAYGFYPATSWLGETGGINTNDGFITPGQSVPNTKIYPPENEHIYSHQKSFDACPEAIQKLEESIQKDIEAIKNNDKDAPKYSLADLQCTTWARQKLSDLGFEDPGGFSPHGAAEALDEASNPRSSESKGKKK